MSCQAHELAEARGFLTREDVDLIQEMVALLPTTPVRVLDLGAGSGTTALSVFCARPDNISVVTVEHDQEMLDWTAKALTNIDRLGNWEWLGVLGDTCEVNLDEPFDMLMIDSSHEYEQTKCELRRWLPKLVTHGLLWLHDYVGEYPGVKQALDEGEWKFDEVGQRGLGWGGVLLR